MPGNNSFNARTYSRRSVTKKRPNVSQTDEQEPESTAVSISRKRRKVEVEQVAVTRSAGSPARGPSTDLEDSPPRKGSVHVTYGSPRKLSEDNLKFALPDVSLKMSPRPVRDLAKIFDAVIPVPSPSPSPVKLSKRMLARSKTESSVDENPNTSDNHMNFERTPSLPNLPSSSPMKSLNAPLLSSGDSQQLQPAPSSSTRITKTYAGNSRSFLAPLSSSSVSSNSLLQNQVVEEEGDDYLTRESYTSLRTRWGVDDSEDDPYPEAVLSPIRSAAPSNSASPNVTPSKKNTKGKGKGSVAPVLRPSLPNGMMNPLKTITELRSKGESRRFLDEVGYLFEGMERNGGLGLRRASALEIIDKLCDAEFTRKARAADFFGKTWDVFLEAGAGRGEDQILDTLLVFLAALVAQDEDSIKDLAQLCPESQSAGHPTSSSSKSALAESKRGTPHLLTDILFSLLASVLTTADPLILVAPQIKLEDTEIRKAGISRKDRGTLGNIYNMIITKTTLIPPNTDVSTRLLITQTLTTIPPSLISTQHFEVLLTSLKTVLAPTKTTAPSSLNSALHLIWHDAPKSLNYENIYQHLRLLDSYLLGQWDEGEKEKVEEKNQKLLQQARDDWLVDELIALCVCAEISIRTEQMLDSACRCMENALRVLVSLTHADELWGKRVMKCKYTLGFLLRMIYRTSLAFCKEQSSKDKVKGDILDKEDFGADAYALDQICLTLGLLTNLVQVVDSAKDTIRKFLLDPSCALKKRGCLKECTCAQPISALDILTRIHSQLSPASLSLPKIMPKREISPSPSLSDISPASDADASFLRGHLAILFGLLMRGNKANQKAILSSLPCPPELKDSKISVVNRTNLDQLVNLAHDFVAFYTVINDPSGDREANVARQVVNFLRELRDTVAPL